MKEGTRWAAEDSRTGEEGTMAGGGRRTCGDGVGNNSRA